MNILKCISVFLILLLSACGAINDSINSNIGRRYTDTGSEIQFLDPGFPYEPGESKLDTFITKIVYGRDETEDYIEFYVHNNASVNKLRFLIDDKTSSSLAHDIFPSVNGTYRLYMQNRSVDNKVDFYLIANRDILSKNTKTKIRVLANNELLQEYSLDNF